MRKKVFLDTNIIIDFWDDKRDGHIQVQLLMKHLILNNYTIMISEDMLSTIFYILKDKKRTLLFLQKIVKSWEIVSYGLPLIKNAIDLSLEKDLDLEDLLQCLCAKENSCEVLITGDGGFFDCGINILTANEFLEEIKNG